MSLIENQLRFLQQAKAFRKYENIMSPEQLRERRDKARKKMLEEQEEISRIDRENQLLRVMCFGKK